jgi:peptide/nickel transport system permease protein
MRMLPGDPVLLYISQGDLQSTTPEQYKALQVQFGLDKSFPLQYLDWISNLFRGDLGQSIFYNKPVGTLISERFPITAHLAVLSLILSSLLGISAGVICGIRRGGFLDALLTSAANFGISVPIFWMGILLIYMLGLYLKWLPIMGYTDPVTDFWLSTKQLIMPVFCMAISSIAANARQTRSSVLEVIRQDYVKTAWSKGLSERTIIIRHVLKNSLIPVITNIGINVSFVFGGSVLIETVFNIPGMGRLIVSSVFSHDFPVVQGCCLVFSFIVVMVNLIVDISYGWLDPRVRYG